MALYQPKIWKFNGNKDSVQWLKEYRSEIGGPEGPGDGMGHVYFGTCLEGAALDWYCNILEYEPKVYWYLLPAAFSSHWDPITHEIHAWDVLPSSSPTSTDKATATLQALPLQTSPTSYSTTNQAWKATSESMKRERGGKGEEGEEEDRARKEGDEQVADALDDMNDIVMTSWLMDCSHQSTTAIASPKPVPTKPYDTLVPPEPIESPTTPLSHLPTISHGNECLSWHWPNIYHFILCEFIPKSSTAELKLCKGNSVKGQGVLEWNCEEAILYILFVWVVLKMHIM